MERVPERADAEPLQLSVPNETVPPLKEDSCGSDVEMDGSGGEQDGWDIGQHPRLWRCLARLLKAITIGQCSQSDATSAARDMAEDEEIREMRTVEGRDSEDECRWRSHMQSTSAGPTYNHSSPIRDSDDCPTPRGSDNHSTLREVTRSPGPQANILTTEWISEGEVMALWDAISSERPGLRSAFDAHWMMDPSERQRRYKRRGSQSSDTSTGSSSFCECSSSSSSGSDNVVPRRNTGEAPSVCGSHKHIIFSLIVCHSGYLDPKGF